MPIQVQAPDGSIAQFPDGMADADIEKVMAQHYPQPSTLDQAVASPIGRFVHDVGVKGLEGAANVATMLPLLNSAKPGVDDITNAVEGAYQGSLARSRNTSGYAAARDLADKTIQSSGNTGFKGQMFAPFLPTVAGASGYAVGGQDASNAMADSQQAAQTDYATKHPVLSTVAGLVGGLASGAPEGVMGKPLPQIPQGPPSIKPGVQEANDAGYVLPPRMISDRPGIAADTAAAWSGKVKTAQAASAKNQEITNGLAARSLGLPENTTLTDSVLSKVRGDAGKVYASIQQELPTMTVDQGFKDAIGALGDKNSPAAAAFPDLMQNPEIDKLVNGLSGDSAPAQFPTKAGMDLVRQLRAKATANFRAAGTDPSRVDLAFAQRGAANAIDDLIERNLSDPAQTIGPQYFDLSSAYKQARTTIAKAHDIEAATNTATGNVSARKIAALAERGRPFTGELSTIANAAAAFPKALQSEAAFGEVEPLSVLDVAAGAAALPHNPSVLGAVLGRPLARKALLSGPAQRAMVSAALQPTNAPLQLPRLSSSIPLGAGLMPLPMLAQQSGMPAR